MTQWKIADAIKVIDGDLPTQTTLTIGTNAYNISDYMFTFYYSYLQTIYGEIVTFNGYYIMIAAGLSWTTGGTSKLSQLTTKDEDGYYHFCYSTDGKSWTYVTSIFCQSTLPGNKIYQGASTAKLILREGTENTVDFIYGVQDNYDGGQDIGRVIYRQSGTLSITNGVPTVSGFPTDWTANNGRPALSNLFMVPDDINYASYNNNNSSYFENPNFYAIEDTMYCIFNASIAYGSGATQINDSVKGFPLTNYVPSVNANQYCGCIGIASMPLATFKSGTYTYTDWTMHSPLITTIGITARPYMPSMVIDGTRTYIFFNSEANSVIPAALYGFVSYNGIMGDYYPLNGTGCVLKNPSTAPTQTSSWTVNSDFTARGIMLEIVSGDETTVLGSPSPVYQLTVDDDRTYITAIKNFGLSKLREWTNIYNSDS